MAEMNKRLTNAGVRARAAVIAGIALVVAAAGVAYAAIPTTGGNLPACVNSKTGLLRVLDTGQSCTPNETGIKIASADPAGRVADAQKLDGKDSTAFLQQGMAAGGALTGTYPNPGIRANAIFGGHVNDLTFSDGDLAPAFGGFLKSFQIPDGAIQGAEIEDDTVTEADIDESTLPSLDGHDAFTKKCDPHPESGYGWVLCAAVSFTAGRPMPVLMTVSYSIYNEIGDPSSMSGECKTALDGVDQGSVQNGDIDPGPSGTPDAGVPMVDVIPVSAGAHTLEFLCRQVSLFDIVYGDIRLAVVELGMD
jgi:hypothetical protein